MEVREAGRCGEIICTSVLRTVNGSRCKAVPREDPNGADGNKCEAVVTVGNNWSDVWTGKHGPWGIMAHNTWSLWTSLCVCCRQMWKAARGTKRLRFWAEAGTLLESQNKNKWASNYSETVCHTFAVRRPCFLSPIKTFCLAQRLTDTQLFLRRWPCWKCALVFFFPPLAQHCTPSSCAENIQFAYFNL